MCEYASLKRTTYISLTVIDISIKCHQFRCHKSANRTSRARTRTRAHSHPRVPARRTRLSVRTIDKPKSPAPRTSSQSYIHTRASNTQSFAFQSLSINTLRDFKSQSKRLNAITHSRAHVQPCSLPVSSARDAFTTQPAASLCTRRVQMNPLRVTKHQTRPV
jgi:hypothetical protein